MIPVKMRVYHNSIFASIVAIIGSFLDGISKLLALACAFSLISEKGFFPGVIFAAIAFFVCLGIGAFLRELFFHLSERIAK